MINPSRHNIQSRTFPCFQRQVIPISEQWTGQVGGFWVKTLAKEKYPHKKQIPATTKINQSA
jgi:hypothetical protein